MSSMSSWQFEKGSLSKAWWPAKAPMQRSQLPSLHQSTPCSSPLRRRHTPLATQAALLLLLLNRVSHVAAHRLLHLNHKAIEDMGKRVCQLREAWVVEHEKSIRFGTGQKWLDVEADEATFDKKVVNKQLQWEQWCGLVQRGGLTPWYCTACVHYRPSFEHQAQVLCARWNGCSSPKIGCRTGT